MLPLIPAAVILVLLLTLGIPAVQTARDPYGGHLAANVTLCGRSIGGMSKKEAKSYIQDSFQDIVLELPGSEIRLSPEQSGLTLDTKQLLNQAYQVGRTPDAPSALTLEGCLSLNEAAIRSILLEAKDALTQSHTDSAAYLSHSLPDLTEGAFQPESADLPALVLRAGVGSYALDVNDAWQLIQASTVNGQFRIDLTQAAQCKEVEGFDADALLAEFNIPAVDARMDKATLQLIPASYGLEWDRVALQEQLRSLQPGEELQIPPQVTTPTIMGREACFQDVLGFCQTPHGNDKKRCENLRLACEALNGVILEPGETLSYNATLGMRTAEAGYQEAPAYSGERLVNSLGGGICQVSSTLYLASLYAELETVERTSHGFPSNYMPVGLDATVSWGSPDLKIKNNSSLPVKLIAENREEYVMVWIMGTETRDYYVRMGYSGSSDRYAKSYVCKYDRETGEFRSREDHLLCSYLTSDISVVGEIGSDEVYLYGTIKKMPVCTPSEGILEESKSYKAPNTKG